MSEQGQGDPLDARDLESLATAAADERGVTKKRVQHWISYMVLVSQLEQVSRDSGGPSFTLKGGVPLEMRLDGQARATRDLDLIDLIDQVSCLSLRYHLAHKIHGMTLPSTEEAPNERARDLVDVFLIRERLDSGSLERVREACLDVFRSRDQHDWPPAFDPPEFWRSEFEKRAADLGLSVATFDDAVDDARRYITALEEAS